MAFKAFVLFFFAITLESSFKCVIWACFPQRFHAQEQLFFSKKLDAVGWMWRDVLQEYGWFTAASQMQLQTQLGQDHINGTSQLHLCSRRTSRRNGIHFTKPLVEQQRHVANSGGKSKVFPWSSYFMQEEKHMEPLWEWTCFGATLSHVFRTDFSLRENGLNRTKILQAKLPAGFNYFRGLNCSQMSLGKAKLFTKSRFLGACPITEHVVSTATTEAGWLELQGCWAPCADGCLPSWGLPAFSTHALDDIYLTRTTWLSSTSQDCGYLILRH